MVVDDSKPRPPPIPPRDRDDRETKAPPVGSPLDRLRKEVEASRKYPRPGTPVTGIDHRTLEQKIDERTKRAADHSETAVSGIQAVRFEMQEADKRLDARLDVQDTKLDAVVTQLADVRVAAAGSERELKVMNGLVAKLIDAGIATKQVTMHAELQVDTAQKLAEVQVDTAVKLDPIDGRKWRRAFALQLFGAGGLVALIVALIAQKC